MKTDTVRYAFLKKALFSSKSETGSDKLPRFIRDLVSLLRMEISDDSKRLVLHLIDDAAWAIEQNDALCIWKSDQNSWDSSLEDTIQTMIDTFHDNSDDKPSEPDTDIDLTPLL